MKTGRTDGSDVYELLERAQLVEARQEALGRRKLGRHTLVLMWGLRLYAVFMFCIVGYQIAHAI
jgi:hypothetical protein